MNEVKVKIRRVKAEGKILLTGVPIRGKQRTTSYPFPSEIDEFEVSPDVAAAALRATFGGDKDFFEIVDPGAVTKINGVSVTAKQAVDAEKRNQE